MRAKIRATSAAEPNADSRPIHTPAPVGVSGSNVSVYVCEMVLVLMLVLTCRLLAKPYSKFGAFRRERWLEMTAMVRCGGVCEGGRGRGVCVCGGVVVVESRHQLMWWWWW